MQNSNSKVARARRAWLNEAACLEDLDAYLTPNQYAKVTRKVNRAFDAFTSALAETRAELTIE